MRTCIIGQLWEDIKDIITKIFLTVESQVNTSSPTPPVLSAYVAAPSNPNARTTNGSLARSSTHRTLYQPMR